MKALWGYCLYLLNKACSIGIQAVVKEFEILGHDVLVIIDGMLVLCHKRAKWDGGGPQTQITYNYVPRNNLMHF